MAENRNMARQAVQSVIKEFGSDKFCEYSAPNPPDCQRQAQICVSVMFCGHVGAANPLGKVPRREFRPVFAPPNDGE